MTHTIEEIKGLDPTTQQKMTALGITTIEDLLDQAATSSKHRALAQELGVNSSQLTEWLNRADLMRLTGVGAEMANLLEECGVDSCRELQHRVPANLYTKLKSTNDEQKITNHAPSQAQIEAWIAEAAVLANSSPPAEPSAASYAQPAGESIQEDLSSVAEAGAEQGPAASVLDYAQNLQKQAAELLDRAPEPVQQFAQDAQAKAQELSKQGQAQLHDAAQQAASSVDHAARATGGTLRGAADSVRSYAPESGPAADVANRFAGSLESTGSYLEQQSERGILANMADWAQRHPLAITLAGGGLLLAYLRMRRRS